MAQDAKELGLASQSKKSRLEKRMEEKESEGDGTPGRVIPQSPHRGPLPGFWMCKYLNFPPGVLMTRVRFDLVLSTC